MSETALVSIYQQPTQYFAYPSNLEQSGIWRASRPSLALSLDASDAEIGDAVLYLLTECRVDVPSPQSRDLPVEERLALLKPSRVRSWMALQRKAKLVSVKATADELRVEPTRNGGNRGDDAGFHFLTEQAERFERNPPATLLGAAIRRGFVRSTPPPAV